MDNLFLVIWAIFTPICLIWLYFVYTNLNVAAATRVSTEGEFIGILIASLIPIVNIVITIIALAFYLSSCYSPFRKLQRRKWFNSDHLK